MKNILLLVFMLAFVIWPSMASTSPARGLRPSEVEGVILNQQKALAKPGYLFERESDTSASVIKIKNNARFQTGTITCVSQSGKTCHLSLSRSNAQCSSGCYFVGARGGVRAQ